VSVGLNAVAVVSPSAKESRNEKSRGGVDNRDHPDRHSAARLGLAGRARERIGGDGLPRLVG
jgi:hypothetical protein